MSKSIVKNFSLTRPVVLIGMMGAGKTSVGRCLGKLLEAPFFDSDIEIERAAGCSVAHIFLNYGEDEFRRLERQVVARLLDNKRAVLSLGGGAFMDPETRKAIKERSVSVWMRVDLDILVERVKNAHHQRPLLEGGAPLEKLAQILETRAPVYAEAEINVLCGNAPIRANALKIIDALRAAPAFQTAKA